VLVDERHVDPVGGAQAGHGATDLLDDRERDGRVSSRRGDGGGGFPVGDQHDGIVDLGYEVTPGVEVDGAHVAGTARQRARGNGALELAADHVVVAARDVGVQEEVTTQVALDIVQRDVGEQVVHGYGLSCEGARGPRALSAARAPIASDAVVLA
jgi:hypothetical protein